MEVLIHLKGPISGELGLEELRLVKPDNHSIALFMIHDGITEPPI